MHGIVASRTFSLRILRQKIFSMPILMLCYTLQSRDAHLMLLDCWRRWKSYWTKRKNWLRARWKFRLTWVHERQAHIFGEWKKYVKLVKTERLEKEAHGAMGHSANRRKGVVRSETKTDFVESSEKQNAREEFERGLFFAGKPLLVQCFTAMNDGAEGKLDMMPNKNEFVTLLRSLWERPLIKKASPDTKQSEQGTAKQEQEDDVSTTSTLSQMSEQLVPVNDRELNVDSDVFAALASLDMKELANCVLTNEEILPEHVERFSIGLGDNYVPLVAMMLHKCTPYIAKRIILGDLKDQVMRCNSPLMALLIGTHVSRWSSLQLTTREVKSLTDDKILEKKSGSSFQMVFIVRCLALVLLKQRCRDLINTCKIEPSRKASLSEEEGVALVLRRQKLQKLWHTEEVMRDLLGVPLDPVLEEEKVRLKAEYAEFYVGKVERHIVVKKKETAVDPWIYNLDLGSLLREYAHLTGSLADTARDMRQPLLKRDDRLLRNGFLKQARKDYLELKAYTKSLRPEKKKRQKLGVKQKKPKKKKSKKKKKLNDDNDDEEEEQEEVQYDPEEMDNEEEVKEGEDQEMNGQDGFGYDSEGSEDESSAGVGGSKKEMDKTVDAKSDNDEDATKDDQSLSVADEDTKQSSALPVAMPDLTGELSPNHSQGTSFQLDPHVIMESWWPTPPKAAPPLPPNRSVKYSESAKAILKAQEYHDETNENIATRMITTSRNSVARIVTLLEQLGLPNLAVRQRSDYCRDKSGITTNKVTQLRSYTSPSTMVNVGANLVEVIHFKPYRLMQLKQYKLWWPRKWWQHERLSHAIENEIVEVQKLTCRAQDELTKVQVRYKEIDKEMQDYTKYMNQMRRRMVAIAGKTKEYDDGSNIQKSALKRLADTQRASRKKKEKALNKHNAIVAKAKVAMEEKRYEDVCSLLMESGCGDIENEEVAAHFDALNEMKDKNASDESARKEQNLAYRPVAKELITKNDALTAKYVEAVQSSEAKLKKAEIEFEEFCSQTDHVKTMFSHMAKEKFSTTLDVQDLSAKHLADLKSLKTSESSHQKVIAVLTRYCDELMAYSDHLVCVKQKEENPLPAATGPAKLGRSSTGLQPPSPIRKVISKTYTVALDTDEDGRVRSPLDGESPASLNRSAAGSRRSSPTKKVVEFFPTHDENAPLDTADDHLDMSLPQNMNTKTLEFLSNKKNRNKHGSRMSLVEFSKKISEEDQFSLNRKHIPSVSPGSMASNLKTAEKEVKISDELARSIRVEITDEYWNILEMMESQGQKSTVKVVEEDSSMTSSVTQDAQSVGNSNSISEDLMFFDEEDLEQYPLLNRKLNRTARIYQAVKQRCLLNDSDSMSYTSWPEIIEEELQMEMVEVLKEEAAILSKTDMHESRRRDVIFEINKRKGLIRRTMRAHTKKHKSHEIHSAIDPSTGELKEVSKDNLLPDPAGEEKEKYTDDQWRSSHEFKQESISMSANEDTNHLANTLKRQESVSAGLERQQSISKVRQRAAATKRRKAVVKVVLMDPFAAAGSRVNDRMNHNAKDDVVKKIAIDESDKFALLQPEQVQWRRDMLELKYELSELEEPRRAASSPEEAREHRERVKRERLLRKQEEAGRIEREVLAEMEADRLVALETEKMSDTTSELSLRDFNKHEKDSEHGGIITKVGSEDDDLEGDGDGKEGVFDFDTLFANGLIDEEEYDRLKIIRAAENKRLAAEAAEEAARKEVWAATHI